MITMIYHTIVVILLRVIIMCWISYVITIRVGMIMTDIIRIVGCFLIHNIMVVFIVRLVILMVMSSLLLVLFFTHMSLITFV